MCAASVPFWGDVLRGRSVSVADAVQELVSVRSGGPCLSETAGARWGAGLRLTLVPLLSAEFCWLVLFCLTSLEQGVSIKKKFLVHGFDSRGRGPWGWWSSLQSDPRCSPPYEGTCGTSAVGKAFAFSLDEVFLSLLCTVSLDSIPLTQHKHSPSSEPSAWLYGSEAGLMLLSAPHAHWHPLMLLVHKASECPFPESPGHRTSLPLLGVLCVSVICVCPFVLCLRPMRWDVISFAYTCSCINLSSLYDTTTHFCVLLCKIVGPQTCCCQPEPNRSHQFECIGVQQALTLWGFRLDLPCFDWQLCIS